MNRLVRYSLLSALLLSCAFAQRDLSTIAGTVTDTSGGVVANAAVRIVDQATGIAYETLTNSAGEFVRPALKPSQYTVTVTAPGFKKSEQKDVLLTAGERTGLPITLSVGDVGQTVEVTAASPLLQTETTMVGANLNAKALSDLPLGGTRNFAYLARLSPGVVPAEPGARDAANGGFSANGVRSNGQNNFLLNGVDNNINTIDFLNQTSYAIGPSVEAIGEMKFSPTATTPSMAARRAAWSTSTSSRGTNQLHGSLFEISAERSAGRQSLGKQCRGRAARNIQSESVWRHGRRTHHKESSSSSSATIRERGSPHPVAPRRVSDIRDSRHDTYRGDEGRRFL